MPTVFIKLKTNLQIQNLKIVHESLIWSFYVPTSYLPV